MSTSPPRRARHPLTLQTRLMATVIGMVALILVAVALATSAILGGILQQNLDNRVRDTATQAEARVFVQTTSNLTNAVTAYTTLENSRFQPGTLLVLESHTGTDGAYLDASGNPTRLTSTQLTHLVNDLNAAQGPIATVTISGIGAYRVSVDTVGQYFIAVVGLPISDVSATIAGILTTVALVTLGGLLLLGAAIALVIRVSLRPLRAVADTATRVATLPLAEGSVSIAERVPADQADDSTEIGRVGAALNMLLDHVDTSLEARQRNEERMRSFVADASHELRTPLASIRGYSELSLRALHQAAPARDDIVYGSTEQALERIQAQSLRMTALVEDLLLLARLDEGQELVYTTVDLTRLAIEAVGDARPAGLEHTWRLEVGDEPVTIAGDEARLHQVVANLLANARTHTPAGTEVTVSVVREDGDAVLRVHDDGPGVDPAVVDDLFERFARGDRSRARKTGGTGLGLSIARAIVQAHHGTITVDSRPGDTTFVVRLPAKPEDPVPAVLPEPEAFDVEPAADESPTLDAAAPAFPTLDAAAPANAAEATARRP